MEMQPPRESDSLTVARPQKQGKWRSFNHSSQIVIDIIIVSLSLNKRP